jgi:hypothetical protein
MNVLLVEPEYYTRYPPLGLLKISALHKLQGDKVTLVRGKKLVNDRPDRVYVTSLFTWDWKAVWDAVRYYKHLYPRAEIQLGGVYASLLPDHARLSGADVVCEGLLPSVEALVPDYSLVPTWKSSILFATRGCPRKCGFCSVPKLEGAPVAGAGSLRSLIGSEHKKVIFFDNNILGVQVWRGVFEELIDLGLEVDFNQGMDARYVNDENAELIHRMHMPVIRLAFDYIGIRLAVEKAIKRLNAHGIRGKRIIFYVLYNYVDDPENFFSRVRDLLTWGVAVYPMRYEPLSTLEKNRYIAPGWTETELAAVARARRVMGYGGALPPYKPLVEKFQRAKSFREAFQLRPVTHRWVVPEPIVEMALEHQQMASIGKVAKPRWALGKDWRAAI